MALKRVFERVYERFSNAARQVIEKVARPRGVEPLTPRSVVLSGSLILLRCVRKCKAVFGASPALTGNIQKCPHRVIFDADLLRRTIARWLRGRPTGQHSYADGVLTGLWMARNEAVRCNDPALLGRIDELIERIRTAHVQAPAERTAPTAGDAARP